MAKHSYRNKACAETGIMLQLEIQKGKEQMSAKQFASKYGSGTSCLLRLSRQWSGSACTVVADSAFASFKSAEALLQHRGLYFIGLVKTATKGFPKNWMQQYKYHECRAHVVLQAKPNG